jgi:hypothetical protein
MIGKVSTPHKVYSKQSTKPEISFKYPKNKRCFARRELQKRGLCSRIIHPKFSFYVLLICHIRCRKQESSATKYLHVIQVRWKP